MRNVATLLVVLAFFTSSQLRASVGQDVTSPLFCGRSIRPVSACVSIRASALAKQSTPARTTSAAARVDEKPCHAARRVLRKP